jgi:hypothetical protein
MLDLYTLFTSRQYQERIFTSGFPKEYTSVGPMTNRVSRRTEAGEFPTIGGEHDLPTER